MSRIYDHDRLTPDQLRAALDQLGLSPRNVEQLTGTKLANVEAWLLPPDAPRATQPPFWLTSWLALMTIPGAADMADRVARAHRFNRKAENHAAS